jgi:hypothetical protein
MSASPTLTGTIAGASLQLSSLTSGRVTYATTSGLLTDSANLLYSGTDLTVYGITVGRGAGAVASNTAVGASALAANTGVNNTALGYQAATAVTSANNTVAVGYRSIFKATSGYHNVGVGIETLRETTTGFENVAAGTQTLLLNTTGSYNVAVGGAALQNNTTASNNTAVGYQAGYSNTTGTRNTLIGQIAGYAITTGSANIVVGDNALKTGTTNTDCTAIGTYALADTTGSNNTAVGSSAGEKITTGFKNTILGRYNGNQGGLDIRTASNYVVLSDGDGNPLVSTADNQTVALEGAVPNSGTGITFPATQSASSNANTLDDYEEGSWTPTYTNLGTVTTLNSRYTKIGNSCTVWLAFTCTSAPVLNSSRFTLPFGSNSFAAGSWTRGTSEGGQIEAQSATAVDCYFANTASSSAGNFACTITYQVS